MQFPNEEDEGDFNLNSGVRSRLSSLFQGEGGPKGDVNQALTFTAPKQPRKNDHVQSNPGEFKVMTAGVVNAFKLVDGNYANQGKLGCAVLGIHESANYQFLLYKAKSVHVMSCKIHPNFKFHVQPNNYVNVYDDKSENWSMNFDSATVLYEIAEQVAIAKANCEGKNQSSLIVQDLALGEGPSLDKGDSAEVKYTGWLLSNYSLGQVFDSNVKSETSFRLRLGKSKVIKGWHEGLVGAQKGCKRLLIVPPNLAYGSEGMGSSVPPNSTLIFEIHVTKVKIARESSHSPSPKIPDPVPDKKPEVIPRASFSQDDNIRLRGASISEQLTQSPKKDKAQLISRMAKMGTATLPLQGAIPAQVSSESENEEEALPESPPVQLSGSRTASPKPSKASSRKNSGSVASTQVAQLDHTPSFQESIPVQVSQHSSQMSLPQATLAPQPYLAPAPAFPGYQRPINPYQIQQPQFQLQMPSLSPSIADTHIPLLITESRTQNAEMRLNLSKVSDKVETVIQKVDELRLHQGRSSSVAHVPFLDSSILVQNIERIVQENSQLKEDAEAKTAKIQVLNDKIHDLFQRNQRFYEENNSMLEQKSDSTQTQAKLLSLEKEKEKLSSELSDAMDKISAMKSELQRYRNQENELNQRLLEHERAADKQSSDSNKDSELLITLKNQLKNMEEDKRLVAAKLEELEKQNKELQDSKMSLKKLLEETESKIVNTKSTAASELTGLKESYEKQITSYIEQLKEASLSNVSNTKSANDNVVEQLKNEKDKILREKDDLQSENGNLTKKFKSVQSAVEAYRQKISELENELGKSMLWKPKYETFYQKTRALKESYDNQITELTAEIKQLQESRSNPVSADFTGELKKVMNALYRILQGKFDPKASYPGPKVLEMTLQAIKGLTFQMLEMKSRASSDSSEQSTESGSASVEKPVESNPMEKEDTTQRIGDGDTNIREDSLQQNGIADKVCDIETKGAEDPSSDSKTVRGDEKAQGDINCDTQAVDNKLVSDSKLEENAPNEKLIDNDANVPNPSDDLTALKSEEPSDKSKASNHVENVDRASPDIWRPQPPPLFDSDEEDDDDDGWLK